MSSEQFSERIRRLRLARGLKVRELASYVGISESTYRDWEYGRAIKGEPYPKLAEIYQVSLNELLTGQSSSPKQIQAAITVAEEAIAKLRKELESFF